MFGLTKRERAVKFKRRQREERINALSEYLEPLTSKEQEILQANVPHTVALLRAGRLTSLEVLKAFGKQALAVQKEYNPITEIMIKDAEKWCAETPIDTPLAGFPVSFKDQYIVKGYDACAGYAARTQKPYKEDGAVVAAIRAAGGVPFVKTNLPITLMNIEGYNDVWGRTLNFHNKKYAPGGSSQGEGCLIAGNGSKIGVGSDIGGSVRVPAAWSGIYSLRMTSHRFPSVGDTVNDCGYEGVLNTASPMAHSIQDLRFFIDAVMGSSPWEYDHSLVPLPWRPNATVHKHSRFGVLQMNDFLPLTAAQQRALDTTIEALKRQGAEIVPFELPEPASEYNDLEIRLNGADGMYSLTRDLYEGEHSEWCAENLQRYLEWPRWIRKTWEFLLWVFGFKQKAHLLSLSENYTVLQYYDVVHRRNELRRSFREAWKRAGVDFLITAPHPSPAVPNNNPAILSAILYTSLFNLMDYPAGIIPVSRVDPELDDKPYKQFNVETRVVGKLYNAKAMAGLPTAVQVVGMRYKDDETLTAMEFVDFALKSNNSASKSSAKSKPNSAKASPAKASPARASSARKR